MHLKLEEDYEIKLPIDNNKLICAYIDKTIFISEQSLEPIPHTTQSSFRDVMLFFSGRKIDSKKIYLAINVLTTVI